MEEKKIQVRFPFEVWETLKELAGDHERSFNGEVIWALRAYIAQTKGGKYKCLSGRLHDAARYIMLVRQALTF
jgi:hypothetical protein